MAFMNNYRKGWALRYIREAKAELQAAQKLPRLAPSLMLEALRKAQFAIYYSLKCLLDIDEMVEFLSEAPELDKKQILRHVNELVSIASEIVELFVGEKD